MGFIILSSCIFENIPNKNLFVFFKVQEGVIKDEKVHQEKAVAGEPKTENVKQKGDKCPQSHGGWGLFHLTIRLEEVFPDSRHCQMAGRMNPNNLSSELEKISAIGGTLNRG